MLSYNIDNLGSTLTGYCFIYTRPYWMFFIPKKTKKVIIFEDTNASGIAGRPLDWININDFTLGKSYMTESGECKLAPVTQNISKYPNINEYGQYYQILDYRGGGDNTLQICCIY